MLYEVITQWLPGTVSVTWKVSGVPKTATDNGSGLMTGDASGVVNYATRLVELELSALAEMIMSTPVHSLLMVRGLSMRQESLLCIFGILRSGKILSY